MLLGSVSAGLGVVLMLPERRPKTALMPSGHRLYTASMPPKLATSDAGNIPKCLVFHLFYKHFAPDTDGVQAASKEAFRRRPGSVRAVSERHSGDVRATAARCPGGIRVVAGRRPIQRQAIPETYQNVWFFNRFFNILHPTMTAARWCPEGHPSGVWEAPKRRPDATRTPIRRCLDAAQTPP